MRIRSKMPVGLRPAVVMLSALGVAAPVQVRADQSMDVEEVIVTARKRQERLQDLPGSAAAITESMIDDTGPIRSLRDVTDLIPGITLVEAASSDLMEPSIRGAGQSRNRSSVSATGFYRNGAYFASQSLGGRNFARMDTYDVERVEVLRGPQGALYGRNALGGAMNIISRRPGDELDFNITGVAGELGYAGVDAIVNVPVNDTFGIRASYVHDERDDGFYKDINGNPIDTTSFDHARIGMQWKPSDALKVYYSFDDSTEDYEPGIRQRFRATQTDLFQTTINSEHVATSDITNHALTIDYALDKGVFTSVTNRRDRSVYRIVDADYTLANANLASTAMRKTETFVDAGIFFQEFRWTSTLGGPLEYLVGADYYSMWTKEYIDPFSAGGQTVATSGIRDWKTNEDSWAVYGSVDYNFTNIPLSLSAEIRYASDAIDGYVNTVTPNISPIPILDVTADKSYSNLPWGFTASWRFESVPAPVTEAMAYFKYGSSYRHGGLNLGAGRSTDAYPTVPIYNEEDSDSYEIGLKTAWFDGMLKLNGSAYLVYYNDFLDTTTNGCPALCPYLDPVTGDSLGFDANGDQITMNGSGQPGLESPEAFFIDNVGKIDAWGVEIETNLNIPVGPGRFISNIGWSRQMGEVTEIAPSVSPAEAALLGVPLNFVRPQQLKANLTWRQPVPIPGLMSPVFKATIVYTMEHGGYSSLSANSLGLDGVDRMDVRVGVDSDHWSFTINGSNVLDEQYFPDRTGTFFRVNDPAYYYAEISWRYR
ncbi:MAG: TonB-dependent receptor [Pseudomonadales bacterium]|nr:TonB-dependent receptor [Pseudomonadales bacterium]